MVRRIPEEVIGKVMSGRMTPRQVVEEYGVTRQAVSSRKQCRRRKESIKLRQWKLLFLVRIGVDPETIAEWTGYHVNSIAGLITVFPRKQSYSKKSFCAERRELALDMMRWGFPVEDVAEVTGYARSTLVEYSYRFLRRGVKRHGMAEKR